MHLPSCEKAHIRNTCCTTNVALRAGLKAYVEMSYLDGPQDFAEGAVLLLPSWLGALFCWWFGHLVNPSPMVVVIS